MSYRILLRTWVLLRTWDVGVPSVIILHRNVDPDFHTMVIMIFVRNTIDVCDIKEATITLRVCQVDMNNVGIMLGATWTRASVVEQINKRSCVQ